MLMESLGGAIKDVACVVPETLILTNKGLKYIKYIKIGDKVLTHLNRWQRVVKVYKRQINEEIYQINNILQITDNHPMLVSEMKEKDRVIPNLGWKWLCAPNFTNETYLYNINNEEGFQNIKEVEFLERPFMDFRSENNIPLQAKVTKELLISIGLFLGDGNAKVKKDGGKVYFDLGRSFKDTEALNVLIELSKQLNFSLTKYERKNMTKVYIGSKPLASFYCQFYNKNKEKFLPIKWLNCSIDQFRWIIHGFYLSDGCPKYSHDKITGIRINNTSLILLNQIKTRCEFSKIYPNLRLDRKASAYEICGKTGMQKDYYELAFANDSCKTIFPIIGDKLIFHMRCRNTKQIFYYFLKHLFSIKKFMYNGSVYNLEVEKDNSYIADGIIVHNCDGLMVEESKKAGTTGPGQSVQWGALFTAQILTGIAGGYIAEKFSYRVAYLLITIFPILIAFCAFKYPEPKAEAKRPTLDLGSWLKALSRRDFLLSALFLFCLWFSPSVGTPIMDKMRDGLHFSKIWIGWLGTIGAVCSLIGALLYFKFSKGINIKKWLFWGTLLSAVSTFAYLYLTPVTVVWYAVLFGISGAFVQLIVMDFCARTCPEGTEATTFALLCSILNFGSFCSNLAGAALFKYLGYNGLIIVSGSFTLLCLGIIPYLRIENKS